MGVKTSVLASTTCRTFASMYIFTAACVNICSNDYKRMYLLVKAVIIS